MFFYNKDKKKITAQITVNIITKSFFMTSYYDYTFLQFLMNKNF